jgi:hypothetical protein
LLYLVDVKLFSIDTAAHIHTAHTSSHTQHTHTQHTHTHTHITHGTHIITHAAHTHATHTQKKNTHTHTHSHSPLLTHLCDFAFTATLPLLPAGIPQVKVLVLFLFGPEVSE